MGLDIGDKRIGIAFSDPLEMLATPHSVLKRKDIHHDLQSICELLDQKKVEQLVIGLPRLQDGSLGTQAAKTQQFVDEIKTVIDIPVEMFDERYSTDTAQQLLRDAGRNPQQVKENKDSAAAALILQWYMDSKNASVICEPAIDDQ